MNLVTVYALEIRQKAKERAKGDRWRSIRREAQYTRLRGDRSSTSLSATFTCAKAHDKRKPVPVRLV